MLEQIITLINQNFKSDAAFERQFNLSPKTVYDWKRKKSSSYKDMLVELSTYFNVSTDFLLGNEPSTTKLPSNAFPVDISDYVKIPVYGTVSAGLGCFAENLIESYEPFSLDSIRHRKEDYICLIIDGDSMYPKLEEGDYILVKKQTSVDSGSYAVLLIDGEEGVAKRVVYGADWIELQSINPMYPPRRFEGEDVERIRVVGLIVESKRKF